MPPKKSKVSKASKAGLSVSPKEEPKTTRKAQSMDDLLKLQPFHPPKKGQQIDAKIVGLSKKGILFDIGWKSYAVLGNLESQELSSYLPYLKEGDVVPVK